MLRVVVRKGFDHLGLLVDRTDLVEMRAKGEGDLARATGEIEQSPMPMHPRPLQKIVDERRWIADAITLVVGRGASNEVASNVGFAGHLTLVNRRCARSSAASGRTPHE